VVVYHSSVLGYISRDDRKRFAALVRGLGVNWLSHEVPESVPGLRVPPYRGAPSLLSRDGREPLAFADMHGTWLHWLG
jgi:hypothetical protein